MNTLTTNFNKAYPVFAATSFVNSCVVEEPSNIGKDALQQIELTGFDGYSFPHEFVAKTVPFATAAQNPLPKENPVTVIRTDCDKVILFERDGQKFVMFCELKSTFSANELAHAKDQVVGSWIKVRSLLQTLQNINIDDYKPIGLIASFMPTDEILSMVSKNEDSKSAFAITLNATGKYSMPANRTNKYYHPLIVGTIDLFYLPVPDRQKIFSVDINSIIK